MRSRFLECGHIVDMSTILIQVMWCTSSIFFYRHLLTLTSMPLGVVYKSDTCVTAEMKAALKAAAAVLEDVDDSKKDWHPHSDEKVLDLVHPSLFPLLYGRSTVLSESEGTVPLRDCDAYIGKVRNSFEVTSPS